MTGNIQGGFDKRILNQSISVQQNDLGPERPATRQGLITAIVRTARRLGIQLPATQLEQIRRAPMTDLNNLWNRLQNQPNRANQPNQLNNVLPNTLLDLIR